MVKCDLQPTKRFIEGKIEFPITFQQGLASGKELRIILSLHPQGQIKSIRPSGSHT